MVKAIREPRLTPVQWNTFYESTQVWESSQTAINEAEPPANKSKVLEENLATA